MVNDGAPTPSPGDGLRATGKWYRLVWSKGNAAMVPERQFRRMDSREYKSAVVEYYSVARNVSAGPLQRVADKATNNNFVTKPRLELASCLPPLAHRRKPASQPDLWRKYGAGGEKTRDSPACHENAASRRGNHPPAPPPLGQVLMAKKTGNGAAATPLCSPDFRPARVLLPLRDDDDDNNKQQQQQQQQRQLNAVTID
ncbi:hypothetical protein WN51_05037 [Melipona quadrifasciata]|uniref:Uncharacterized protein n=1 Tax=Melipona quadrifasciata TaxID=166423 RepID=A0A0N1IT66_9HYME|nr:hypothetical protein WN51_05037 [Melipona quadrifasciata]